MLHGVIYKGMDGRKGGLLGPGWGKEAELRSDWSKHLVFGPILLARADKKKRGNEFRIDTCHTCNMSVRVNLIMDSKLCDGLRR